MSSRLINGCSKRQAARHIASFMAQRKVQNNRFNPNGCGEHFSLESDRFDPFKRALSSFRKSESDRARLIVGHHAEMVFLH